MRMKLTEHHVSSDDSQRVAQWVTCVEYSVTGALIERHRVREALITAQRAEHFEHCCGTRTHEATDRSVAKSTVFVRHDNLVAV